MAVGPRKKGGLMRSHVLLHGLLGTSLFSLAAAAQIPQTPVSQPILGAYGTAGEYAPAVANSGTGYLVGWHARAGNDDMRILLNRVDAEGNALDGSGFWACDMAGGQTNVDLIFDGTEYWAVWQDDRGYGATGTDVYATRVSTTGEVLDPEGILVSGASGDQTNPRLAFNGSTLLVVFEDTRAAGALDVYGARIDPTAATVLDPNGIEISREPNDQSGPNATTVGTDFFVTFDDRSPDHSGQLIVVKVGDDGTVDVRGGTPVVTLTTDYTMPRITASADTLFFGAIASYSVPLYAVDPTDYTLLTPDPLIYTFQSFSRNYLALGYGSDRLYAAWAQTTSSFFYNGDIVNPAEEPTLANEHTIATNSGSNLGLDMSVAGADFAFSFLGDQRVYMSSRSVDDQTSTQNFSTLVSPRATEQRSLSMVYGGGQYLAAWAEEAVEDSLREVRATRISESGQVVDEPSILVANTGVTGLVQGTAVAISGTTGLVAWSDERSGVDADIYAARLNVTDGTVLDATPLYVSTAEDQQWDPKLAAGNEQFLATWFDLRTGVYDVYAARVGLDGQVLDVGGIQVAHEQSLTRPDVVFDGANYVVAYCSGETLYVRRITPDGTLVGEEGVAIASVGESATAPSLVQQGSNTIAVFGGADAWDPNVMAYVVFDRNDQVVFSKTFDSAPDYPFRTPAVTSNGTVAVSVTADSGDQIAWGYTHSLTDTDTGPIMSLGDTKSAGYGYAMAASPVTGTILLGYVGQSGQNTYGSLRAYYQEIVPDIAVGGAGGEAPVAGAAGLGQAGLAQGGGGGQAGSIAQAGALVAGNAGVVEQAGAAGEIGMGGGAGTTEQGGTAGDTQAGSAGTADGMGGAPTGGRAQGGAVGQGGNQSRGGTTGRGGNTGSGGRQGFGGARAQAGDDVSEAGVGSPEAGQSAVAGGTQEDSGDDDSGCGCRTAPSRDSSSALGWLLGLGLWMRYRSRRNPSQTLASKLP